VRWGPFDKGAVTLGRFATQTPWESVDRQAFGFKFPHFTSAWETLAGVTTAHLPPNANTKQRMP
jgi:hypothetical protein